MTVNEITQMLRARATISVLDAGQVLGMSKTSVYAAAHSGELPVIRVGKRFLVPSARLAEMLGVKLEAAT